ncbi:hypothetical protein PR048_019189 [Dryococelus australis]|uniref:Uncharacterized protein n=1 Tax=Dryococelus australis TaxID=614101 RepID=A0ABQ9H2T1_9NEOP|nr:hypothetical protein PR048_019189 [Dryococelus australis]
MEQRWNVRAGGIRDTSEKTRRPAALSGWFPTHAHLPASHAHTWWLLHPVWLETRTRRADWLLRRGAAARLAVHASAVSPPACRSLRGRLVDCGNSWPLYTTPLWDRVTKATLLAYRSKPPACRSFVKLPAQLHSGGHALVSAVRVVWDHVYASLLKGGSCSRWLKRVEWACEHDRDVKCAAGGAKVSPSGRETAFPYLPLLSHPYHHLLLCSVCSADREADRAAKPADTNIPRRPNLLQSACQDNAEWRKVRLVTHVVPGKEVPTVWREVMTWDMRSGRARPAGSRAPLHAECAFRCAMGRRGQGRGGQFACVAGKKYPRRELSPTPNTPFFTTSDVASFAFAERGGGCDKGDTAVDINLPTASSGTILTYESPGVTQVGIEPVSLDLRMNKVVRPVAMIILHKAEEHTTCIQVDLKQGFQKCSFYREQRISTLWAEYSEPRLRVVKLDFLFATNDSRYAGWFCAQVPLLCRDHTSQLRSDASRLRIPV